jgi:hypothetical protein
MDQLHRHGKKRILSGDSKTFCALEVGESRAKAQGILVRSPILCLPPKRLQGSGFYRTTQSSVPWGIVWSCGAIVVFLYTEKALASEGPGVGVNSFSKRCAIRTIDQSIRRGGWTLVVGGVMAECVYLGTEKIRCGL